MRLSFTVLAMRLQFLSCFFFPRIPWRKQHVWLAFLEYATCVPPSRERKKCIFLWPDFSCQSTRKKWKWTSRQIVLRVQPCKEEKYELRFVSFVSISLAAWRDVCLPFDHYILRVPCQRSFVVSEDDRYIGRRSKNIHACPTCCLEWKPVSTVFVKIV